MTGDQTTPRAADAIVIGGGLVGAASALKLAGIGLTVRLISAVRPGPQGATFDQRVYAISPGGRDLLQDLGVWQRLPADRIEPVYSMAVSGDRPGALLDFDALEAGVEALAYIVDGGALARVLWDQLETNDAVHISCPARPLQLLIEPDGAKVICADESFGAPLVIGADGAESWTRTAAGIDTRERAYPQRGVVANFACERDHERIARQWFRADGVLALLPLPGRNVSMVWSANEQKAAELMALESTQLSQMVGEASEHALGALAVLGPPAAFSLRAMTAKQFVAPRVALVGDAAHNLHPLAGQGVNLGFRDVRELGRVLSARGPENDLGATSLLRRYERARREDAAVMLTVTDGLQRLFSSALPGVAWLRNTGLEITGRIPLLKQALVERALS